MLEWHQYRWMQRCLCPLVSCIGKAGGQTNQCSPPLASSAGVQDPLLTILQNPQHDMQQCRVWQCVLELHRSFEEHTEVESDPLVLLRLKQMVTLVWMGEMHNFLPCWQR